MGIYGHAVNSLNEGGPGFFKKKERNNNIKKFIKFANEALDKKSEYYGDLGYNFGEVQGTILALKFLKVPESKVLTAIKDNRKNICNYSDYEEFEDYPDFLPKNQKIAILYRDEDAPFINLKDDILYHCQWKDGIKKVSLYSLVDNNTEKIYFTKEEFDKYKY